jgi:hypothetical protein
MRKAISLMRKAISLMREAISLMREAIDGHHASCRIDRVRLRGKEVDVTMGRSISSEADQLKSGPDARVQRARDLHKPLPATSQVGAHIEPELALVVRERHAPIELARIRRHSDSR